MQNCNIITLIKFFLIICCVVLKAITNSDLQNCNIITLIKFAYDSNHHLISKKLII